MDTLDELYNTQWLLFLFRRCAKDTHSARMCAPASASTPVHLHYMYTHPVHWFSYIKPDIESPLSHTHRHTEARTNTHTHTHTRAQKPIHPYLLCTKTHTKFVLNVYTLHKSPKAINKGPGLVRKPTLGPKLLFCSSRFIVTNRWSVLLPTFITNL